MMMFAAFCSKECEFGCDIVNAQIKDWLRFSNEQATNPKLEFITCMSLYMKHCLCSVYCTSQRIRDSINITCIWRLDKVNDPSSSNRKITSKSSLKSEMTPMFQNKCKIRVREWERQTRDIEKKRACVCVCVVCTHLIWNGTSYYNPTHPQKKCNH